MEPKEHFPRIITDIQNVVSQLVQQFESSKEPITDDNTCLHKLCAKLEFVLSISLKEKSILGQKRSYWQWFYTCLRKKTGLNDSLKFVQANTQVRSSKGRGRAFIRYCLVHQTLADSLQNCLMIEELNGGSTLKQDAVLGNKKYSSVLISCLYDLNAVYFDLNSKGYDLDAGWPTFASKRSVLSSEHWAVQSQMALGSLPPPSVIMDSRIGGYHPSDRPESLTNKMLDVNKWCQSSSGPPSAPSVDQRIEELVLELDQSDKTIKEQTKTIRGLESRNDSLEKSTMEKEDILAGVISDLETKNRHLHDAMSHMSSEYQTRDEYLTKKLSQVENKSKELQEKNVRLQDDKYNLEQLVSCRMTAVTQNFTSSSDDLTANEKSFYDVGPREVFVNRLQDEVDELRSRAERSEQYTSCLEALIRTRPELNQHIAEMKRMVEEEEDLDCTMLPQSIDESIVSSEARILHRIMSVLGMDEDKTDDIQMEQLVEAIDNLKEIEHKYFNLTDEEKQNQRSRRNIQNDEDGDTTEIGSIKADRDFAMMEADGVRQQLSFAKTNVQDYKLQLEIQNNESNQQIAELEEQLMLCRQQNDSLIFQRTEMMTDLTSTQEGLKVAQQKVEALTRDRENLESELAEAKDSYEQSVFVDDQLEENRRTIAGLQSELRRNGSCNSRLSHELEQASDLVHKLKTDLEISNTLVESYTTGIQEVERRLSETEHELVGANTNAEEQFESAQEARLEVQNLHNENEANRRVKEELAQLIVNFSQDFRELDMSNEDCNLANDEDDDIISSRESLNDRTAFVSKVSNKFINLLRAHASIQSKLETNKDTLKKTKKVLEATEAENTQVLDLLSAELDSLQKNDNSSSQDQLPALATSLIDNYKEIVERRDSDIEQLKDKIGQLLQDKDKFWQDAHQLRSQLNHEGNETCSVCGKDNAAKVDGETATKCANCRENAGDEYVGGSLLGSLNHLMSSFSPSVSAVTASPGPPPDLAENEDYVEVEAKKIFQLPVFVEEEGLLVKWTITANLDINFSLFYTESEDEDDEETVLIETQRIDCHLQPFSGQILAKCVGVYTLVLDNSYSKFTSKQVRYKLDIINPQDDADS